jgi:hypothetical protein
MGGESGPKIRPKGVVDGKQVNIPVLFFIGNRGTKETKLKLLLDFSGSVKVMRVRRKTILELRRNPYSYANKSS